MAETKWLDGYSGETVDELIGLAQATSWCRNTTPGNRLSPMVEIVARTAV